jgi:hypothetical protein
MVSKMISEHNNFFKGQKKNKEKKRNKKRSKGQYYF